MRHRTIRLLVSLALGLLVARLAADHIRSIRDLKGTRVGVTALGSGRHLFFASVLAYVGLDPRTDVHLVTPPAAAARRLFTEGNIDAYVPFAEGPTLYPVACG